MKIDADKRTAWKAGFMAGLAEAGLTPVGFAGLAKEAAVKRALLGDLIEGALGVGKGVLGGAADVAVPAVKTVGLAALLGPPALGAAAGIGSAVADSPGEEDFELLRKAETLALLRRLTRETRDRLRAREAPAA